MKKKFVEILRDDSGQAMTEYLVVTIVGFIIAGFWIYPGNGIYSFLRYRYDLTYWLLTLPGP